MYCPYFDFFMAFLAFLDHKKDKKNICENSAQSMRGKGCTYRELEIAKKKIKNVLGKGNYGCAYKGVFK